MTRTREHTCFVIAGTRRWHLAATASMQTGGEMTGQKRITLALVALAILAAACGREVSGESPRGDDSGKRPAKEPTADTKVAIDLTEYEIVPELDVAPAGAVTLEVRNAGKFIHAFSVLRTDLPHDALPRTHEVVDVTAPGIEVVDFLAPFEPGSSQQLEMSLAAGNYVFICNIGHYHLGMAAPFTVE
jgi:uncharacterized cupredoxin-like copper-binding protein